MNEDVKAWLIIAGFFIGIVMVANVFSNQPSRSEDPESYYDGYGYECSDDCSGHKAGYEWARENDVCDLEFNGGNSESFAEGVRVYAEDNCASESGSTLDW